MTLGGTYLSGSDGDLDLSVRSGDELSEGIGDLRYQAQSVVLRHDLEQVGDGFLVSDRLGKDIDDDGLVIVGESWVADEAGDLGVGAQGSLQLAEGAGDGVQRACLGGSRIKCGGIGTVNTEKLNRSLTVLSSRSIRSYGASDSWSSSSEGEHD